MKKTISVDEHERFIEALEKFGNRNRFINHQHNSNKISQNNNNDNNSNNNYDIDNDFNPWQSMTDYLNQHHQQQQQNQHSNSSSLSNASPPPPPSSSSSEWTINDVKQYAYAYMNVLFNWNTSTMQEDDMTTPPTLEDESENYTDLVDHHNQQEQQEQQQDSTNNSWTSEEIILFDTLIATYGPNNFEKISVMIPYKTKEECRERYYSTVVLENYKPNNVN